MSHEVETAFYVRKPAWHRLGNVLNEAPSIAVGIQQAGLDWTVEERPLFSVTAVGEVVECEGWKRLVRSTDETELGVCRQSWKPLQNAEAFRWFQPFLETGKVHLEAGGSLQGGRRVWVLARIDLAEVEVAPGDCVGGYLLLTNPHAPGEACGVAFTGIRVVCMNTLGAAVSAAQAAKHLHRVRHTQGMATRLEDVREALESCSSAWSAIMSDYREMARSRLEDAGAVAYFRALLEVEDDEAWERCRHRNALMSCLRRGQGTELQSVRGTVWGAYNAVTEWIDHHRTASDSRRAAERRLVSSWYGEMARVRRRAHAVAMELAR